MSKTLCVSRFARIGDFEGLAEPAENVVKPSDRAALADLQDITASLKGDSDAYRRLVEKYQSHIGKIMWRFSRDERVHEELVQNVFVEAYLSLKTYKTKAVFSHWLARIATHVGYHFWKQEYRRKRTESLRVEDWDEVVADESEDVMEPEAAGRLVHELLGQMAPRDRLVLTLRYLEQCDVAETAQRTGWSKAMVKVQSHRAMKKLKNLIGQLGLEIEL